MLHDTLAHAQSLGLDAAPVSSLPRLQDIDTAQVPDSHSPGNIFIMTLETLAAALAGCNPAALRRLKTGVVLCR